MNTHGFKIKKVECCYMIKEESAESDGFNLDLRLYTFDKEDDLSTIKLIRKTRYKLKKAQ